MHRYNHYPTQPQTLGEDSWPMYGRNDYPVKPQSEEALWPMHRCNDYPTQPLTLGEGSWPMYRRNDYPTQPQMSLNEKASCQMYEPQVREIQAPHWPKTQPILALPTALQRKRLRPLRPGRKAIPKAPLRKVLTDEDRQSICQYHEANPSAKQTEIGVMFGVDRSTISKLLKKKDIYLLYRGGRHPLAKRAERKPSNIGRALEQWALNSLAQGIQLTGSAIDEKGRLFATVGNNKSFLESSEFEEFKQRSRVDRLPSPASSQEEVKVDIHKAAPFSGLGPVATSHTG
ncbi:hypothetical protein V501_02712 [Pseudogymnoascus sp. VKM F-4519 (FW-2642)]|nr:hypothetical protein V501_02712 [Pseudogymnoascus sp. VKM F-4519 (FW-2642)]